MDDPIKVKINLHNEKGQTFMPFFCLKGRLMV